MYIDIVTHSEPKYYSIIYTNQFVDAATVTSDSPVHTQPGPSSQAKLNNVCEYCKSIILLKTWVYIYTLI